MKKRLALLSIVLALFVFVCVKQYKYVFLFKAMRYEKQSRFIDGAKEYEKYVLLDPDNHQIFFAIGLNYSKAKKHERAIHYFKKSLEFKDLDEATRFQYEFLLGNSYVGDKKFDQAVDLFKKLNAEKPSAYIYVMLVRTLRDMGKLDEALRYGVQGVEKYPESDNLKLHMVSTLIAMQQFEKAEELLLDYTSTFENSTYIGHVYNTLGNLYAITRRWNDAEVWLMKALEVHPTKTEFIYELGNMYYNSGRFDLAEVEFKKILDESLDVYPDVVFVLGRMYYHSGYPELALNYFEKYSSFTETNLDYIQSMIEELKFRTNVEARKPKDISVVVKTPKGKFPKLYLRGNWYEDGSYRFLPSWQSHSLKKQPSDEAYDRWILTFAVRPDKYFPVDVVIDDDEQRDNGVVAYRTFSILNEAPSFELTIDSRDEEYLVPLTVLPAEFSTPKKYVKSDGGKRRVHIMWVDSGSWPIISRLIERGHLPNTSKLLKQGAAANMYSPHPHTAMALKVLTYFPENARKTLFTLFSDTLLQIKGLRMFEQALSGVSEEKLNYFSAAAHKSIWQAISENNKNYINFVFSDYAVFDPNDSSKSLSKASKAAKPKVRTLPREKRRTAYEFLVGKENAQTAIDQPNEFDSNLLTNYFSTIDKFLLLQETLSKESYDLALVRFPECDLIAHKFWNLQKILRYDEALGDFVAKESPYSFMLERFYRIYDAILGSWVASLGPNDVFLYISDHGSRTIFDHDVNSLFIAKGPSIKSDEMVKNVNMVQFPATLMKLMELPTEIDGKAYPFMEPLFD